MLRNDVKAQKEHSEEITKHRIRVQQELVETRQEFQAFIDVVYPFNRSESKYILPAIKSFTEEDQAENDE
jgi:hemerythrin superfamily protein